MRIIAYTYEADVHCPACAASRFGNFDKFKYTSDGLITGDHDHNGIAYTNIDREGNPIHPVFDIDEDQDGTFTHCGDCREELT
jgi:hypothetical protein